MPASWYLNHHSAFITAVTDGTDTIRTEGSFPYQVATGGTYSIVRNDRILIYNTTLRNWRMQDSPSVRAFCWFESRTDKGELFAALDSGGFVDLIDNDAATTDTGAVAITSLWRSNWFTLPQRGVIRAIYVYQQTGTSLTLTIYVDQSTTATQTVTGFTPSADNLYRAGVFAYGRQVQIQISGDAMNPIDRIWIEWEAA